MPKGVVLLSDIPFSDPKNYFKGALKVGIILPKGSLVCEITVSGIGQTVILTPNGVLAHSDPPLRINLEPVGKEHYKIVALF